MSLLKEAKWEGNNSTYGQNAVSFVRSHSHGRMLKCSKSKAKGSAKKSKKGSAKKSKKAEKSKKGSAKKSKGESKGRMLGRTD